MWKKLGLILVLIIILYKGRVGQLLTGLVPLYDFDTYYQTAQDVFRGLDPHQIEYMQTAGPPLVIIPYLPFILLNLQTARIVMILLSLISGFVSTWLLADRFLKSKMLEKYIQLDKTDCFLIFSSTMWASFPARFSLGLGQPNLILMLMATYLLVGKNDTIKSQALAILALIKTNFLILFVSNWKNRWIWLATGLLIGIVILALPIVKPAYYQNYFSNRASSYIFSSPNLTDLDYYNQSLRSFLGRLNLDVLAPSLFVVVAIGSAAYLFISSDVKAGILLSILASPIVWQHYFIIIFPVACLMMLDFYRQKSWKFWLAGLFLIMTLIEFPQLHLAETNVYSSIFASHFLIGLFGLIALQITNQAKS